jgi:hypothetical protein
MGFPGGSVPCGLGLPERAGSRVRQGCPVRAGSRVRWLAGACRFTGAPGMRGAPGLPGASQTLHPRRRLCRVCDGYGGSATGTADHGRTAAPADGETWGRRHPGADGYQERAVPRGSPECTRFPSAPEFRARPVAERAQLPGAPGSGRVGVPRAPGSRARRIPKRPVPCRPGFARCVADRPSTSQTLQGLRRVRRVCDGGRRRAHRRRSPPTAEPTDGGGHGRGESGAGAGG